MASLSRSEPMCPARRVAVGLAAGLFVGSSAWQVIAQRDDWPLSCFPMYSGLESRVSSRSVVKGVSDEGEFELVGAMLPLAGDRIEGLVDRLSRSPKRQRRFLLLVQQRYLAKREAQGWPVLQGLRSYSEFWTIQPGLAGIDRPNRSVSGSLLLPPRRRLGRPRP